MVQINIAFYGVIGVCRLNVDSSNPPATMLGITGLSPGGLGLGQSSRGIDGTIVAWILNGQYYMVTAETGYNCQSTTNIDIANWTEYTF